jgi:molybdenum cofactor biosynthesis enzyme MoaA
MSLHPVLDMPAPRSLVLRMDITNNCNLDCIGCALADNRLVLKEPASPMKMEVFERIADEVFPYLREVALSCEAEPTLHPQFVKIMDTIGKKTAKGTVLPVRMTTNATLLTPARMDAIFDSGLAGLTVSIDGYRAETFARLREGGEVEKVFAALDEVVRRKTALGHHRFDYPQIQINYTLMKSNLDELIPLIEHSRRWELENFTVVHVYSAGRKDMSHEFLVDSPEESDRILRQARQ